MNNNLLNGGLVEIKEVKQDIITLDNYKSQKNTLDLEEKTLSKKVDNKNKTISSEITKSIKKRKSDITDTYDHQIENLRTKKLKVQSKKNKTKKTAEESRLNIETEGLQTESNKLKVDKKSIFKQDNIPFVFKNRLFSALFLPKGVGDICLILFVLLFLFFILPCGVYFLWFSKSSYLFLALFYIITIILFGGLYLFINKLKYKHIVALKKIKDIRIKLNESKRAQKIIGKRIKNDNDESQYGLEEYNNEIKQLENEISNLIEQKKSALVVFENTTQKNIKEEITQRNQEELDTLKSEYNRIYAENKKNEGELVSLSTKIANNYEAYLGKDFMSVEKISQLEELLFTNKAKTIANALALLKK